MRKIVFLFIISSYLNSCKNQEKIDLENLSFKQNATDLFRNTKTFVEPREINTTLSVKYTTDLSHFKFGNINLAKSNPNDMVYSKIGIILKNQYETTVSGVVLHIENTEESKALASYLKSKMGNPKILTPQPHENENGEILGNPAFLWDMDNTKAIILTQSYEYTDGESTIASLIYIVPKDLKVSDQNNELVIERLIRTYKQ